MRPPPTPEERLNGAVAACRQHPQSLEALLDLIDLLCEAKQLDVAESTLQSVASLHEEQSGFHEWLGRIAFLRHQFDQAIPSLQHALELDPSNHAALKLLGLSYFQLSRFTEAIQQFKALLTIQSEDALVENCLGVALAQSGCASEGVAILSRSADRNPQDLSLLTNLADALSIHGESEAAEQWYRKVIEADPTYGQAHVGLVSLIKYKDVDHPDLAQGQWVLNQGHLTPHNEAGLRFALGKAYNDCQAYDLAFEQYRQGNNLRKKEGRAFDHAVYAHYFEQIKNAFGGPFFSTNTLTGSQSQRPVFIVGMYRSGTSLVEQIVASHPAAFGAGELLWFSQATSQMAEKFGLEKGFPNAMDKLTIPIVEQMAQGFEAELIRISGSDSFERVTDKMPHNYFYLGLIARLFPNARVIHCQRQPMDTCLSIYFQDFTNNLSYTNDLQDLGRYYALYADLMAHWREHLPLRMYEVSYDQLVCDPEQESRRIMEFLGLPWHPDCLQPHLKQRTVNTASHWQVRQRIHTQSKQRWKHYEKHLHPLKASLGSLVE
ncbi:MAG: sulfotransferase [Magnetococcales bacterium]|nr:sulfotransferase [Magnetococcales bacterium]